MLVASQSGREVNLSGILQHELSMIPRSLEGRNQKLDPANKSQLVDLLTEKIQVQPKWTDEIYMVENN